MSTSEFQSLILWNRLLWCCLILGAASLMKVAGDSKSPTCNPIVASIIIFIILRHWPLKGFSLDAQTDNFHRGGVSISFAERIFRLLFQLLANANDRDTLEFCGYFRSSRWEYLRQWNRWFNWLEFKELILMPSELLFKYFIHVTSQQCCQTILGHRNHGVRHDYSTPLLLSRIRALVLIIKYFLYLQTLMWRSFLRRAIFPDVA